MKLSFPEVETPPPEVKLLENSKAVDTVKNYLEKLATAAGNLLVI